MKQIKRKKGL